MQGVGDSASPILGLFFIATTDTCIYVCGRVIFFASAARLWAYGGRLKDMLLHLHTERLSIHAYVLRMRKRNSKHCHVAGAHIEQSLIDRDFHSGGKKEMDPKLMIEINEKRKYVLESRQDRDGGIKYFMLHWKPHSELLLKPQLLRKPCISTYF